MNFFFSAVDVFESRLSVLMSSMHELVSRSVALKPCAGLPNLSAGVSKIGAAAFNFGSISLLAVDGTSSDVTVLLLMAVSPFLTDVSF